MILIIVGANDIGNLNPIQITQGIIEIANNFSAINIHPIIIPHDSSPIQHTQK